MSGDSMANWLYAVLFTVRIAVVAVLGASLILSVWDRMDGD